MYSCSHKEAVNSIPHFHSPREPAQAVWALWTKVKSHSSARDQTRIPEVIKQKAKLLYQLSCPDHSPICVYDLYICHFDAACINKCMH